MTPKNRSTGKAKPRKRSEPIVEVKRIVAPVSSSEIIVRRGQPIIRQPSPQRTIVSNVENILSVAQAVLFGTTRVNLTPFSFPWLNNMATCYSKWRWVRLRMIYIPNCSTATDGLAVLSLGYDTGDTPPTSVQLAQQSYRAVSFPVWGGVDGCEEPNKSNFDRPPSGAVIVDLDVNRMQQPWYPYEPNPNALTAGPDRNTVVPAYIDVSVGPGVVKPIGILMAKLHIEFIEPMAPSLNV